MSEVAAVPEGAVHGCAALMVEAPVVVLWAPADSLRANNYTLEFVMRIEGRAGSLWHHAVLVLVAGLESVVVLCVHLVIGVVLFFLALGPLRVLGLRHFCFESLEVRVSSIDFCLQFFNLAVRGCLCILEFTLLQRLYR